MAIADKEGHLDLRGNSRKRVFLYPNLPAFLTDARYWKVRPIICVHYAPTSKKQLQEAARGRSPARRFGDYQVSETLAQHDHVAEYLAHNVLLPGKEQVRLRVFTYNPYLPKDELDRHRASISREAEALQSIGNHPNLIGFRTYSVTR